MHGLLVHVRRASGLLGFWCCLVGLVVILLVAGLGFRFWWVASVAFVC